MAAASSAASRTAESGNLMGIISEADFLRALGVPAHWWPASANTPAVPTLEITLIRL